MSLAKHSPTRIFVLVTPYFNLAATSAFLDPFRAANYLSGNSEVDWTLISESGGQLATSFGIDVETRALADFEKSEPTIVVVSSSWAPESGYSARMSAALRRWHRSGARIGGLDTGAFILAKAALLDGKSSTVHYEHIDALIEVAPKTKVQENLFVIDGSLFTGCGGTAATDLALHLLREMKGSGLANSVARFIFHHHVRGPERTQNPQSLEPTGHLTPAIVRKAIDLMESNLEDPLSVPGICAALDISQRQLGRLFRQYVGKTPVEYYRDSRLDRARGLVTQTEMKLSEVAAACGFNSQVHFSRSYRDRFGLQPSRDRIEGRVPFEFRAWPMHDPGRR